jgi:hypothetical protein
MHLNVDVKNYKLNAQLVPNAIGESLPTNSLCIALENHYD